MDFFQIRTVDVRIHLGGGDIGMPEHFLHSAQISSTFEQVRREGMAECVRVNVFGDSRRIRMCLDNLPDSHPCQGSARPVQKEHVIAADPPVQTDPAVPFIAVDP
jgi:hypothetical protein